MFRNRPIRNKHCLWWPCFSTDQNEMSNLYSGPYIDASYQVSFIWQSSLMTRFLEIDQSETRTACGGHVCIWIGTKLAIFTEDLPQMLPAKFRIIWPNSFKNQPIRNKNRLQQPCLLMNRDILSNHYRGPPIDDTYQVSVCLAKRFQRRRFFTNQLIRNKNCLWRPCFLPSYGSFGQTVSEEKNFKNQPIR